MGIIRSTFVIDEKGIIQYAKYKVSVKGHVEEIVKLVSQNFLA